jgi:predicted phosphoadenosine phosphosulfate sulfurtransferase
VVLNRPYAFVQWLRSAVFPERYVLMSEPDHIWIRPMPNIMMGQRPAAFPFFYIEPAKKEFQYITEKFTGPLSLKQAESIAPIGAALRILLNLAL